MGQVMSLKYRPKTFSQMFGQDRITRAIQKQVASGRIPRAWMFIGESGSGKTTIANILSVALNCTHQKVFGEPCINCRKNKADFQIERINAAAVNGVKEIKELAVMSEYLPVPPARRRVFILDEAQRLTKDAQNVLLDYTENPPRTTVWEICTTEIESILRTLRRRFTIYPMVPLRPRTVEEFVHKVVKKAGLKRPVEEFIEYANQFGLSSPAFILQALEKYEAGIDPDRAVSGAETDVDTKRICRALVEGEWGPIRAELEKAGGDDGKLIQQAVIGYLRSVLLAKQSTVKPVLAADCILDLSRMGWSMEYSTALAYVAAVLHKWSKKFPG